MRSTLNAPRIVRLMRATVMWARPSHGGLRVALAFVVTGCLQTGMARSPATQARVLPTQSGGDSCAHVANTPRTRLPDSVASRLTRLLHESLGAPATLKDGTATIDRILFAYWLQSQSPGTELSYGTASDADAHGPDASLNALVCASIDGRAAGVFRLGAVGVLPSPLDPHGIQDMNAALRLVQIDTVNYVTETGVSSDLPRALADTLRQIEDIVGGRAKRPAFIVAFVSAASFVQHFPVRWRDGYYGDFTVAAAQLPSVSFMAPRGAGFSSHELTHVALTHSLRDREAPYLYPYFVQEALARAIGGSQGRSVFELSNSPSASEAKRRLAKALSEDIRFDTLSFATHTDGAQDVDILGAAYRVAVLHCRTLPRSLLLAGTARSVTLVVAGVSQALDLPRETVVDRMAVQLATSRSVLAELRHTGLAYRQDCRD